MKVLVIEDNEILSRNIVRFLSSRDIFVNVSFDWKDGLYKALTNNYDVIILDINLPLIDGRQVCRQIRDKWRNVSIIMLTSNSRDTDIVEWLNLWADDYLVKPFNYNELVARLDALNRRSNINKSNTKIIINNIILDLENIEVKKDWNIIQLSKLEFELFKFLSQNRGKLLSREEIYSKVWWESSNDFIFSKTIDVYIWYLRKKLWKDIIETKKGYWFIIN